MGLAVLGDIREPVGDRLRHRPDGDGPPLNLDFAGGGRSQAEQDAGQFRPPGAHQTGESQDFAPFDGQRNPLHAGGFASQPAHLQSHLAQGNGFLREKFGQIPAGHQLNQAAPVDLAPRMKVPM